MGELINFSKKRIEACKKEHGNRISSNTPIVFVEGEALDELRKLVTSFSADKLSKDDLEKVIFLLCQCWDEFDGASDTKMASFKLNRAEDITFTEPSTIEFVIERHGGTVLGSVYAELHHWTVNIEEKKAYVNPFYGKRQLYAKDKAYTKKQAIEDAKSVADSIINNKEDDQRLKWTGDSKVRVLVGKIVLETNQQTTTARRRRFRDALEGILKPFKWQQTYYNVFEKRV